MPTKQNKPSIIQRLFAAIFKRKPKIKQVSYSTESADDGVVSQEKIFDHILKNKTIGHKDINNLAKTLFNTEIDSNLFCFRSGGPYGLVLSIYSVHVSRSKEGGIDDIYFTMKDYSFGTSLEVIISVKDFKEMLRPFNLKLPTQTS